MTRAQLVTGIAVAAALVIMVVFFIYNPFTMSTAGEPGSSLNPTDQSGSGGAAQSLVIQDETVGTGAVAAPGMTLTVNYTGKLQDGTVFDTSVGRAPFQFTLGAGEVIKGWDQGVAGMKVGGKRMLVIPPNLGYGRRGAGGVIPPDATLVFEVELLGVH